MPTNLHTLKGTSGYVLSVDELVQPEEEHKVQVKGDKFEGGDVEIITHVKHLIVVENGEIIDIDDSEEEGESGLSAGMTLSNVTQMCKKLEGAYWRIGHSEISLALPQELHHFPWLS
ncbi:hypothetical protein V8B97DRAFT_1919461 [Scleroderma yunnanense]